MVLYFFLLLYRLLRIRLKRQNPILSYIRERKYTANVQCSVCTVHFVITLFNVGNVLLCIMYQLNFTIFMYFTRISRYIQRSVFSVVSCNRSRSSNVLPMVTGSLLYMTLFMNL